MEVLKMGKRKNGVVSMTMDNELSPASKHFNW